MSWSFLKFNLHYTMHSHYKPFLFFKEVKKSLPIMSKRFFSITHRKKLVKCILSMAPISFVFCSLLLTALILHQFYSLALLFCGINTVNNSINTSSGQFHFEFSPSDLNISNRPYLRNTTLFFNRVPKVGSQTVMKLLNELGKRNSFDGQKDPPRPVEMIHMGYDDEKAVTKHVSSFVTPTAFVMHTSFCNFTKHGFQTPLYFNFVRDPIERVISWFYYIRAPWRMVERYHAYNEPLPSVEWIKKDFEHCVLSGDRECLFKTGEILDGTGDHRRQIMFFCGNDLRCRQFNGEFALAKAKRNVERYYAVVGVLEEMNNSLEVLEAYLPLFFEGARNIFKGQDFLVNRNVFKPQVREKVKDYLRQNFTREIEFYEFCKQRLYAQWKAVYD